MGFNRRADRILTRFGGPQQHGGIGVAWVVPVGADRIDSERAVWFDGGERTTGAASVPIARLDAITGDVEVVAFGVFRPSARLVGILTVEPAAATSFSALQSLGVTDPLIAPNGQGYVDDELNAGITPTVSAPAGETLWLPIAGTIVPAGRSLVFRGDVSSTLNAFIAWRNIEGGEE